MTNDINHNLVASTGALQQAQAAGGSTTYAHGVASNWVANAIHHSELVLAASHLASAHGVAVPFTVQLHPSAFAPLPPVVHGGGGASGAAPPPAANFSPTGSLNWAAGNGYTAALAAPVETTAPFQYANYAPQERPPSAVPEPEPQPEAEAEPVAAPATAAADNERPPKRRCVRLTNVEPSLNIDTTSSDKSGSSTDTDNSGSGNDSGSDYGSGSGSDGKKKVRNCVYVCV